MPSERDPVDSHGFNSVLITIWCQVWGFSLHFVVLASYFLYMFIANLYFICFNDLLSMKKKWNLHFSSTPEGGEIETNGGEIVWKGLFLVPSSSKQLKYYLLVTIMFAQLHWTNGSSHGSLILMYQATRQRLPGTRNH